MSRVSAGATLVTGLALFVASPSLAQESDGGDPQGDGSADAERGESVATEEADETDGGGNADEAPPSLSFPGPSRSHSIGRPHRGRLLSGIGLRSTTSLVVRNPRDSYGTRELVELIRWATSEVERQAPGSRLLIGDLSRRRGGRLRPHRSHRAGRDADIGFYLLNEEGEPVVPRHFITMANDGTGTDRRGGRYRFDVPRNWLLIEALMRQEAVPIQYVMVIRPLQRALVAEGQRRGAAPELLRRVKEVVGPRRTGRGRFARRGTHDSHFHVRIYCAADDRPRCRDAPPIWDWVDVPPPTRASPASRRRAATRRRAARRRAARRRAARRARSMRGMRSSMRSRMRSSMRSRMRSSMRSRMRSTMRSRSGSEKRSTRSAMPSRMRSTMRSPMRRSAMGDEPE